MRNLQIAIVGATGLVGQMIIKVLHEENLLKNVELTLYASDKSHGKVIIYYGNEYRIVKLSDKIKKTHFDVVFFSAGDEISKKWATVFAETGAFVIDNTNAFRKESYVPVVVPEINAEEINDNTKIISNPNCSTIELVLVLDRLKNLSKIGAVIVSTYQAVSGAGRGAILDLENQTSNVIKDGINNNVIPQIGTIDENGNSTEENKIMFETNKILKTNIQVVATAVRVPVQNCHTESVFVKFENEVDFCKIQESLNVPYIEYNKNIVSLKKVNGTNMTFISRLRQVSKTEILFIVMADNLKRGAAYNAVKIYQYLLNNGFVKL